MKREDLSRYFIFADAVIGQVSGLQGSIERQALLCKKPLIHYLDPKYEFNINGKKVKTPFILKSNEPSEIASVIDTIVDSQKIRDKISEDGFDFIQKISNPAKIAKEWDDIFKDYFNKYQKIESTVSNIKISFLRVLYLISNRLHFRKMKIFNKC